MLNFGFYNYGYKIKCEYEYKDTIKGLGFTKYFYCNDECTAHKAIIEFNQNIGDYHPSRYTNFKLKGITVRD
jgi:hypothetical protein